MCSYRSRHAFHRRLTSEPFNLIRALPAVLSIVAVLADLDIWHRTQMPMAAPYAREREWLSMHHRPGLHNLDIQKPITSDSRRSSTLGHKSKSVEKSLGRLIYPSTFPQLIHRHLSLPYAHAYQQSKSACRPRPWCPHLRPQSTLTSTDRPPLSIVHVSLARRIPLHPLHPLLDNICSLARRALSIHIT
jgi:hypothetical protein